MNRELPSFHEGSSIEIFFFIINPPPLCKRVVKNGDHITIKEDNLWMYLSNEPEMEFKEFEPRFESAKTRFKLSAGLNLEKFDTILSGTNHI